MNRHTARRSLAVRARRGGATLAAALSLALLGCNTSSPAAPAGSTAGSGPPSRPAGAPRVTGAEAHALVAAGAVLLDVRTAEEFADGHIEGAQNLPVDQVRARLATLPRDKPIVVYCAVGARSAAAAQTLFAAGYDVRNLGPMASWGK